MLYKGRFDRKKKKKKKGGGGGRCATKEKPHLAVEKIVVKTSLAH